MVSSAVAAMTPASGVTAGNLAGPRGLTSDAVTTRMIPHASGSAPANATVDSRIPSTSSCQNTRRALPPSARRIATWWRRVSERARVRPARLAHATARRIPIRRQEHPERGAVPVAQGRKARRERRHVQPLTEQRLPLGFGQRGRQRRRLNRRPSREQFRARRVDGHAARETSDHLFRSKRRRRVAAAGRSHQREGHDDVETAVGLKTVETVRRDADHRRRHRVDLDHLADARTIPEDAPAVTPR